MEHLEVQALGFCADSFEDCLEFFKELGDVFGLEVDCDLEAEGIDVRELGGHSLISCFGVIFGARCCTGLFSGSFGRRVRYLDRRNDLIHSLEGSACVNEDCLSQNSFPSPRT